jgi:Sulfotransferase domain
MTFHTFDRPRPKIAVVSHERSGTHFLMNSIAKCYGYLASPWINFDYELGLNFYHPPTIAHFLAQFRGVHLANIVKSHHAFAFFESIFPEIASDFHIFYVYRDPRDVMISYWKFIRSLPWHEGPKPETCNEFIRSEPCGQMIRYQYRQEKTVLHRWLTHVDSWTQGLAATSPRVTFVRFHDLAFNYESVLQSFAPIFGEYPFALERPALQENSILPNTGQVGTYKQYFNDADLSFFNDVAGPAMQRLGFEP